VTTSVAIAEAIARQDFDSEDIVTDLINRAEAGLQEVRKRGGNDIISLETARSEGLLRKWWCWAARSPSTLANARNSGSQMFHR